VTSRGLSAHSLGDSAVTITFGTERTPQLLERIHASARSLEAAGIPHVTDIVPAYLALTVFYDALHVSYDDIAKTLIRACEQSSLPRSEDSRPRNHIIRVEYDGADLDAVAAATRLSAGEVIERHTARQYTVDLLGFVPGFAYLSELDPLLELPRRPEPRQRVPAGSVAIAASQTAVYPLDTPGGWHIIGRTETAMFDPTRDPPALLRAGDTVRFERAQ
jgi:KipI family sensor histidine kinase inhibitor